MQPVSNDLIASLEKEICFRTDALGKNTFRGLWEVWRFYLHANADQKTYYDCQCTVQKVEKLLLDAKALGFLKAGVEAKHIPPEMLNFEPQNPKVVSRAYSPTLDDSNGARPKLITSAFERNRRRH